MPDVFTLTISTERAFTAEEIGYLLVGEFEGNPMASWINKATPVTPEGVGRTPGHDGPWYDDEGFLTFTGFAFTINYDDPDEDSEGDFTGMRTINMNQIKDGLRIMAEDYPDHFADLVGDNADAITYDVAMQCIVLGSVIYG